MSEPYSRAAFVSRTEAGDRFLRYLESNAITLEAFWVLVESHSEFAARCSVHVAHAKMEAELIWYEYKYTGEVVIFQQLPVIDAEVVSAILAGRWDEAHRFREIAVPKLKGTAFKKGKGYDA